MILALFGTILAASPGPVGGATLARLALTSPAFGPNGTIPVEHTCDGGDRSPALSWAAGPPQTKSYALVVDDPDAPSGVWLHWTVWNIPATMHALPDGVSASDPAFVQGRNDFRRPGWSGPCPPRGHGAHRYVFHLYALDTTLGLRAGASRAEVEKAMAGHVLAKGEITGTYGRR
jgi:hypothetical protein